MPSAEKNEIFQWYFLQGKKKEKKLEEYEIYQLS